MKRLVFCVIAIIMILAVPLTGFAATEENLIQPTAVATGSAKISRVDSRIAKISATSGYDSTIELVATAQLQRKVNGSWQNYGSAVSKTAMGTSVTAEKTVTVLSGYEYRVKGTHRMGVQTKTTYSSTLTF